MSSLTCPTLFRYNSPTWFRWIGVAPNLMRVIGLTGGVGTGKSTVSQFLQELGAVLLDADKVAHESYLPDSPVWKELIATFGEEIRQPNREIDRRRLGGIVFNDPEALAKLNSIVHPRMREMMEQKLKDLEGQGVKTVVLEAAILIEANWTPLVGEVWVTDAPEDTVIQRLQRRSNWTEEQIRARMGAQLSSRERQTHAQVVVDTNSTLDAVKQQVRSLWDERIAGKD